MSFPARTRSSPRDPSTPRSAPAQNARPAPVMTMTRIASAAESMLELADAGDRLCGECFVEFNEIDLIYRQPGALERLLRRRDGTESHAARIDAGHCGSDDARQRRPPPSSAVLRRHKQCRRAV